MDTPLWFSITCGLISEKNQIRHLFFIVVNQLYLKKWRQDEMYDNCVHWSENLAINSVTRNICNRKLSLIIWIHLSVPCLGQQIGRRPKMCHKFFFWSKHCQNMHRCIYLKKQTKKSIRCANAQSSCTSTHLQFFSFASEVVGYKITINRLFEGVFITCDPFSCAAIDKCYTGLLPMFYMASCQIFVKQVTV